MNSGFDILDCTLRDGGYYTDWDFEESLLDTYFAAIRALPVSAVEVGYRSPVKDGYFGAFFHLSRPTLERCRAALRPDQKMAVMLNFKDMTAERVVALIEPAADIIQIVRFACPPDKVEECIEYSRLLKKMGLEVAINVMYLGRYVDTPSILDPLADAADAVDHVALVDSYGGVRPDQVTKIVEYAVDKLPQRLGFHGHDNLTLAFANSCAAVEAGASMVDSTITGMGRGAGNVRTELVALWRESLMPEGRPLGPVTKAVDAFERMQRDFGWGTNPAYMLSGFANLPQADVMDWLGTKRYQMDSIVEALMLQGDAPVDATAHPALAKSDFGRQHNGKPVLIIGGGATVPRHLEAIKDFARAKEAVIVHSSLRHTALFQGSDLPQVVCLAGQELARLGETGRALFDQPGIQVVTTPPPRFRDSVPENTPVCQAGHRMSDECTRLGPVPDDPPLDLATAAAEELAASKLYLAGFDGYAKADVSQQRNAQDVAQALARLVAGEGPWGQSVVSLTPTRYDIPVSSVHALLQPGGQA